MAERASALSGHYQRGNFGKSGEAGVILSEVPGLVLHQLSAWPDTLGRVGVMGAEACMIDRAPSPGRAAVGSGGALLRIEPLKWWCYDSQLPELAAEDGTTLDLSHSRTHLRVRGQAAQAFLNRLVSVDLRPDVCPLNSVMSTGVHHVGITLWYSKDGFELFVPRGFALSLWEVLTDTAAQFGVEIA
jgi:heterotetrameric sarcosine oxidase gamma subunit